MLFSLFLLLALALGCSAYLESSDCKISILIDQRDVQLRCDHMAIVASAVYSMHVASWPGLTCQQDKEQMALVAVIRYIQFIPCPPCACMGCSIHMLCCRRGPDTDRFLEKLADVDHAKTLAEALGLPCESPRNGHGVSHCDVPLAIIYDQGLVMTPAAIFFSVAAITVDVRQCSGHSHPLNFNSSCMRSGHHDAKRLGRKLLQGLSSSMISSVLDMIFH